MTNIDASTPQLKVIMKWIDAHCSLDMSNLPPLMARKFKFLSFPNTTDLPEVREQTTEEHIQWLEKATPSVAKLEFHVHEVIEAPGKVVTHVTAVATLIDGNTYEYDSVSIFTLVEEDGEIKVLQSKDFSDPYKRSAFYEGIAKVAAQGAPAS